MANVNVNVTINVKSDTKNLTKVIEVTPSELRTIRDLLEFNNLDRFFKPIYMYKKIYIELPKEFIEKYNF